MRRRFTSRDWWVLRRHIYTLAIYWAAVLAVVAGTITSPKNVTVDHYPMTFPSPTAATTCGP